VDRDADHSWQKRLGRGRERFGEASESLLFIALSLTKVPRGRRQRPLWEIPLRRVKIRVVVGRRPETMHKPPEDRIDEGSIRMALQERGEAGNVNRGDDFEKVWIVRESVNSVRVLQDG
jgi:hypothetical protein